MATTAPATDSLASQTLNIGGAVHGGQQPIFNATVILYAAGTSGYGSAATKLATTTSDSNGNFAFVPGSSATGEDTGTTNNWSCPSTTSQIYITAIGGNTQGTGGTSVNNAASVLLAPLGPCNGISGQTQVIINEVTTVAGVFALAPYINPGTESIGTNSSSQAVTGLNNAVATIANLASISQGTAVTSNTYTGTNISASTVTITATPETAKIITLANILAACINTSASNSNNCADLFSAATPPSNPATTSFGSTQSSGYTFPAATDTFQAAYYMATNPAELSAASFTTCNDGGTTRMSCLFNLAASSPPFQTGLSTQPSDWTIGVNFTAAGYCNTGTAGTNAFFNGPSKEALDASGNLWFVNGGAENSAIAGLTPVGKPLVCVVYGSGSATNDGVGIGVDPSGNIWATFDNTNTQGLVELPVSTITTATAPNRWETLYDVYGLAIDGQGNIFMGGGAHTTGHQLGGQILEVPSPGTTIYSGDSGTTYSATSTLPAVMVAQGLSVAGTSIDIDFMAPDHNGNIWATNTLNESVNQIAPTTLNITGYSITSSNSAIFCTSTAPPSAWASGQVVTINGLANAMLSRQGYTVSSTTLSTPCTTNSFTATLIASGANVNTTTYVGANTATPASPTLVSSAGALVPDSGTVTGYTPGTYAYSTTANEVVYGAGIDAAGNLYVGTTCCAATGDHAVARITPNAVVANSQISVSPAYLGGDNGTRSIALDGAGNIWEGNILPATGTAASTGSYAIGEIAASGSGTTVAFTALSPSGTAPTTVPPGGAGTCGSGYTSATAAADCPDGGGFIKSSFLAAYDIEIDPSGNVWVANTGSDYWNATTSSSSFLASGTSITEVVGAAVPVVTPLAVAAANGTQATKP